MPAFTFEKISPPRHAGEPAAALKPKSMPKPRSIVSQMIDRLTVTKLKRQEAKKTSRRTG